MRKNSFALLGSVVAVLIACLFQEHTPPTTLTDAELIVILEVIRTITTALCFLMTASLFYLVIDKGEQRTGKKKRSPNIHTDIKVLRFLALGVVVGGLIRMLRPVQITVFQPSWIQFAFWLFVVIALGAYVGYKIGKWNPEAPKEA